MTQSQLCGDECQGIAGGFGGQGRATRKAGIDLNNPVIFRTRIQGKLDVAFPHNSKVAYHSDCHFAKLVIFRIRQCLTGSHHDAFTGMDPHRIEILHIAYRDAVIETVTDDFVFDFLPPFQEFFDEDLRTMGKSLGRSFTHLFGVPT